MPLHRPLPRPSETVEQQVQHEAPDRDGSHDGEDHDDAGGPVRVALSALGPEQGNAGESIGHAFSLPG
jgi:hypothetical protein